jgi:hypothetical protein
MNNMRLLAAVAALAATAAFAQPETALAVPARTQVAAVLNLDAPRARQVDAILEAAYARMSTVRVNGSPSDDRARLALLSAVLTIRYETDTQLASVLSPDEFARLKESLYPPRWERALPSRGTAM